MTLYEQALRLDSRALDAFMVEHVMNCKVNYPNELAGFRCDYVAENNEFKDPICVMDMVAAWKLKRFSTDVSAAMVIYFKMLTDSWRGEIVASELGGVDVKFTCGVECRGRCIAEGPANYETSEQFNKTLARTICLAAIKAMDLGKPK